MSNCLSKNIRVKNNSESINEPEFTLVDDGVEILNISPSIEEQEIIIPSAAQTVKVSAVTSSIDSNILPENIKAGVNILGVDGVFETVITPEEYDDCLNKANMILGSRTPLSNGLLVYYKNGNLTNAINPGSSGSLHGDYTVNNNYRYEKIGKDI